MLRNVIALVSSIQLVTGQLFKVHPEGVRCHEYNDSYTISCEVLPNNSRILRQVILIGLSLYPYNGNDTDTDMEQTSVYCAKRYNQTAKNDVYELVTQGDIAVRERPTADEMDNECQRYIDGIRAGALTRITFSLRYLGHERSLGCFYQLQGIGQPYYRGHGRIYSINGMDVCLHSNVEPPKPSTTPSTGAFIDLQLSTVVLIVGVILLVVGISFLSCAYCQIQRHRRSRLRGRIEDSLMSTKDKEILPAKVETPEPTYSLHKSLTENFGGVSKHKLSPSLSLPTLRIYPARSSLKFVPHLDTAQPSTMFPHMSSLSSNTDGNQPTTTQWSTTQAQPTIKESLYETAAGQHDSKDNMSTKEPIASSPSQKTTDIKTLSQHISFQDKAQHDHSSSTGLAKRQSSPGNLNTEPANQSEAMTDPDRPISLVKSPERVHSECISTKSSKRSVEDGGAAGRTKSLPLTACHTQTSLWRLQNTSADRMWDLNQAQLPGSTYMITADEMYEFFKSRHQKEMEAGQRKEVIARQGGYLKPPEPSYQSVRKFSLSPNPYRKRTTSPVSVDQDEGATSNYSIYHQGSAQSIATTMTVKSQNESVISGLTDCLSDMSSPASIETDATDFHGYLGLLKKTADDKKALPSKKSLQANNKHLKGLAKMVVMFNRLQDEDGDGKSAKSELPTVTEAVSEVTPGQEKPLSGVKSSSHKGGAEKLAGRKGSKKTSLAKMRNKAKSIGILSKAFGAPGTKSAVRNESAGIIGGGLRANESKESQYRSKSQGAILGSTTSIITGRESTVTTATVDSKAKTRLPSLLRAASKTQRRRSSGGGTLGDLMLAALAKSRTQSLASGIQSSQSRDHHNSKQKLPSEESDTERRLRIAKNNKKVAAGTRANSRMGSLLRKAIAQNKVGARPLTKELTDKVKVSDKTSTLRNAKGKGQTSTEIGQSNTSSQKSDQSKSPDPTEILTHGNDKSDDTSPHLDSVDIQKDFSKHSDSSGREETTTLLDRSKVYEIDSS